MVLVIALVAIVATLLGFTITLAVWNRRDTTEYKATLEDHFMLKLINGQLKFEIEELQQTQAQLTAKLAAFETLQQTTETQDATHAANMVAHGSPNDVSTAMGELYATTLPGSTAEAGARSFAGADLPSTIIASPF